ncbi:hypothetical protein D3C76_1290410 [compost metagenome]
MLEQARVGAAVDRRGDHQQVGGLDGAKLFFHLFRQLLARQGATQRAGDVAQLDEARPHGDLQAFGQLAEDRLGQDQGARGAVGAAGDCNDVERGGHAGVLCCCGMVGCLHAFRHVARRALCHFAVGWAAAVEAR